MTNNIAIVCDSVANIPNELVQRYNIDVVSLTTKINDVEYRDVDIDCEEFYKLMRQSKELPKTSQATYVDFIDVFKKHTQDNKKVIYISVSSKASGTYQSATLASKDVDGEIYLFDSLSLSYGCGALVVQAARMVEANYTVEQILSELEVIRDESLVMLAPNSLEYLHKGGRLSTSKAMVGSILNIKPILIMENGSLTSLMQVRGSKKLAPALVKMLKEKTDGDFSNKTVAIGYGDNVEDFQRIKKAIEEEIQPKELVTLRMNSSVCSHTGPEVLGVVCVKNEL